MNPSAPQPSASQPSAPLATSATTSFCIEHADLVVTMDAQRRELRDGAVVTDGPAIVWVGVTADLPPALREAAHEVIDARGRIVLPGFVNTHHHFYQTLTRVIPAAQDAGRF
ncbi:MAG TPA: hypothetical protein PL187_18860, partial [Caldilinea sp.]|nr:hypothetical protein [Caldilinea sp.]